MKPTRLACTAAALLLCAAAHPPAAPRQAITLQAGIGRIVNLPAPAASVFAADPKIVEVRPASATSLFLFGVAPGRSTVAAMTHAGRAIEQMDVTVVPSGYAASATVSQLATAMPGAQVTAMPAGHGIVLNGEVDTPIQAERASAAAGSNLGKDETLDDRMTVRHSVQVNLRVRVLEMSRSLTRDLGVNWQAMANLGAKFGTLNFASALPLLNAATSTLTGSNNFNTASRPVDVNTLVDALAQDQLVHVLAEPNITAMSGESASFLVGGEFPIPVAQFGDTISIEFKQYGVSLAFVPTVLDDGRINLHVRPEVSQLTTQGAIQLQSGTNTIQIPALQVRRAETTVELGSGQSFAIAGLLQDSLSMTGNNVPFIGDLPILGALFRSDNFQRNQTELVILVTPYLVRPATSPAAFTEPDKGWRPPNDIERILLLRQAALGKDVGQADPPTVPGDAGFIVQ
ncbi:type II and III secretion system protein family protein [Lichenicoccus sp.]|uniref:type II and III secretion system protein family protein n=1 Tax=Lichenicoccus sp. TaxID=2781899 RepID=UPI003D0F403C